MHYAKLLLASAAALPGVSSLATLGLRDGQPIVDTTTLPNGQIIDWVLQDEVAPPTGTEDVLGKLVKPLNGPKGAVPYLRPDPNREGLAKSSAPGLTKRQIPDGHKYALTSQEVNNIGGGATFSSYDPFVADQYDFSLIQTAIRHDGVQNSYWNAKPIRQTVESGWIKYPAFTTPAAVHLFTFFNANGYNGMGNYAAGFDTQYLGWKQVDTSVFPGQEFPHSVIGGEQHDVRIEFNLIQDKWWLSVGGRNIGYYPTSLFNQNVTSGASLASGATGIAFYGEIYSSNPQTTTDMGSGEFPSAGYQKAAYMRNIVYKSPNGVTYNYDANPNNNIVTDPNSYQLEAYYNSGAPWDSYILVGGPGYGGNVGS